MLHAIIRNYLEIFTLDTRELVAKQFERNSIFIFMKDDNLNTIYLKMVKNGTKTSLNSSSHVFNLNNWVNFSF